MIERTLDYRRVKKLVDWPLVISSKIFYLIQTDGKKDQGVWSFEPDGKGLKGHADIGNTGKGRQAIEGAKDCIKWIFQNTGASFVSAAISRENLKACLVASRSGMESLGVKDNIRHFKIKR
jgi:hypothetical protein